MVSICTTAQVFSSYTTTTTTTMPVAGLLSVHTRSGSAVRPTCCAWHNPRTGTPCAATSERLRELQSFVEAGRLGDSSQVACAMPVRRAPGWQLGAACHTHAVSVIYWFMILIHGVLLWLWTGSNSGVHITTAHARIASNATAVCGRNMVTVVQQVLLCDAARAVLRSTYLAGEIQTLVES